MNNPPHPGLTVGRTLQSLSMSVADAAAHLGVTRAYLSDVLAGMAGINADLAVRLAAAFDSKAETWLGMQVDYDVAQASKQEIEVARLGPASGSWDDFFTAPGIDIDPRGENKPQDQRDPYDAHHGEPGVLRDSMNVGEPASFTLRMVYDLVKRNGAETDERLRVLADAVERIVEKLDTATSRARRLPHDLDVLAGKRRDYVVLVEGPEGAHTVIIPDLPHLTAWGPTYKQAVALATANVEAWAMQELAAGRELPEPRDSHYIINDPKYNTVLLAGARPKIVTIRPDELRERLRARSPRANGCAISL